MGLTETVATYVGIVLFLLGIALSAAFVGRRTRDPVAHLVLGEFSLVVQLAGIVSGLLVAACGLVVGVGIGNMERYHRSTD